MMEKILFSEKMSLNKKISKIPFWILFGIITFYVIWDFIFTYLSLKNNPNAYESNPVNAFFVSVFGIDYFLFFYTNYLTNFIWRYKVWSMVNFKI